MASIPLVAEKAGSEVPAALTRSRDTDYFSEKGLAKQIGHPPALWGRVILKELLDNALDACEDRKLAPDLKVFIDEGGIEVRDNGPGLTRSTIEDICDFSKYVSSREAYISPTRGAQGNGLKTLLAIPLVLETGLPSAIFTDTGGTRLTVRLSYDEIQERPHASISLGIEKTCGHSSVRIGWRSVKNGEDANVEKACSPHVAKADFLLAISNYAALNPHAKISAECFGETVEHEAVKPRFSKWSGSKTSAHWYSAEDLAHLAIGHVRREQGLTVRDFVCLFDGLSASAKRAAVLERTGLSATKLGELIHDQSRLEGLLEAMRAESKEVDPDKLGPLGKRYLYDQLKEWGASDKRGSLRYGKSSGVIDGTPYVLELVFGELPADKRRRLLTAINHAPTVAGDPFRIESGSIYRDVGLNSDLSYYEAGPEASVAIVAHLIAPQLKYLDAGKTQVDLGSLLQPQDRFNLLREVLDPWRKKVERERSSASPARSGNSGKRQLVKILHDAIEDCYLKASSNGTLPALVRQLFYVFRAHLEEHGHSTISYSHFTNSLHAFLRNNPGKTSGWKVVCDPRGKFHEPHTGLVVENGTLDVEHHLKQARSHEPAEPSLEFETELAYPTIGPRNRVAGILYVEKEGFSPLFKAARIAETYDLAICSTKGFSNVAFRRLVDEFCGKQGIPLYILTDFDISGFGIKHTATKDSERYRYEHHVEPVHFGLRLGDAQQWGLASEPLKSSQAKRARTQDTRERLEREGATSDEIEFLCGKKNHTPPRRIELNAFTPEQLVQFLKGKLDAEVEAGSLKKVIPEITTLEDQCRRALRSKITNFHLAEAAEEIDDEVNKIDLPENLEARVRDLLHENPALSWDQAVNQIARSM